MDTHIAIVGGGIGGLGAALSLLRAGFDVHVYEQAQAVREVGAGIQISPNASRVLHALGLGGELETLSVRPLAFHQRRWQDGRTLAKAPLGDTVERTPVETAFKTSLQGQPDGEYVTVVFQTKFADREMAEVVTTVHEPDGKWRITGYSVQ